MIKMLNFIIMLGIFLLIFKTEASMKISVKVDGREISAVVEKINPVIELSEQTSTQNTVLAAYINYNRLLSQGKIKEAAQLTTSPAATEKTQNAYMERLGGLSSYKQKMTELFTLKIKITNVIEIKNFKMLLGTHPEYSTFANFFDCSSGKCLLSEENSTGELKDLALIFSKIREGKFKIP